MPIGHNTNTKEGYAVGDKKDEALDGAMAIFRQQAIDEAVAATTGEAGQEQGEKAKAQVEGSDGSG